MAAVARFRFACSPGAWSAFTAPRASGNTQVKIMLDRPNACCIAVSWPGSAISPPAQYGEAWGGVLSAGAATVGSRVQKAEPGSRSWTIAVTTTVEAPSEVSSSRLAPGRSPRTLAVWVVAATPTAPAGTGPAYDPATTCA